MKTIVNACFVFGMVLVSAMAARARLGETVAEIYQRYGAVKSRISLETDRWAGHYSAGYWSVIVTFQNGRSVTESFQPLWTRPLDAQNVRALMDAAAGNTNWIGPDFSGFTTNEYDGCLESKKIFGLDSLWTNNVTGAVACYCEALGNGDVPDRPILTIFARGQR
ncbi:MAG TPA: hypothetical protein VMF08_20380 [Candidatus Sulfotelmatobacter sp.]|nr:hypothetical protein [Candidatus Sulfotelmatobacter sp.]